MIQRRSILSIASTTAQRLPRTSFISLHYFRHWIQRVYKDQRSFLLALLFCGPPGEWYYTRRVWAVKNRSTLGRIASWRKSRKHQREDAKKVDPYTFHKGAARKNLHNLGAKWATWGQLSHFPRQVRALLPHFHVTCGVRSESSCSCQNTIR